MLSSPASLSLLVFFSSYLCVCVSCIRSSYLFLFTHDKIRLLFIPICRCQHFFWYSMQIAAWQDIFQRHFDSVFQRFILHNFHDKTMLRPLLQSQDELKFSADFVKWQMISKQMRLSMNPVNTDTDIGKCLQVDLSRNILFCHKYQFSSLCTSRIDKGNWSSNHTCTTS